MPFTFKSSGKIIKNKELLPSIHLVVADKTIAAIQADIEHMNAFLALLQEDRSYITNEISFNGRKIDGCEDLFMYFPDMGEYKRMTSEQMIDFWSELYEVQVDREAILTLVDLADVKTKKTKTLTYPERKRLQFARSLIQPTSVFLFKDPTYQLDLQSKQVFNQVTAELLKRGGIVILFTSSLEEAIRMGSSVFRLSSRGLQEVELDQEEKEEEIPVQKENQVFQRKFEKISAKSDEKVILFEPLEVDYVETRDRQTILHVNNEEFISTVPLKDLENKLLAYGFYRCHRSYLVNLQRVREVVVWSKNSYSLTLDNRQEQTVPLSKSRYGELKALLDW